jgi:hypothetical protein
MPPYCLSLCISFAPKKNNNDLCSLSLMEPMARFAHLIAVVSRMRECFVQCIRLSGEMHQENLFVKRCRVSWIYPILFSNTSASGSAYHPAKTGCPNKNCHSLLGNKYNFQ